MAMASPRLATAHSRPAPADCRARALALWPGLDRSKLRRTHGDPARVARLIEPRTCLTREAIVALLTGVEPEPGFDSLLDN